MPVVVDPVYGPKPSLTMTGGSPSTLAQGSTPFMPAGRSITLVGGQLRTVSYVQVYRSQPWVGRACRFVAEQFARLPLQTFRYLDDAGDTRERDRDHAAAQLLSRPRPGQTGFHLRWDIGLSLSIHGEYVAWKKRPRRGRPPTELWTLDWRSLVPYMDGNRVLAWEWLGAGVPGLERGDLILVEDTLHLSFSGPGGGQIGVSPLEQLGTTVRSEDALQRYGEAAMRNGTRFGVAAILDPKVKPDVAMRHAVREELMDAHGGVDNAFRPAVLGGGITDVKPLGEQSAVEAELLGQRRVNREEIAAVLGLPGAVIGILDEAKYSSLKELHRMLYVTSLGGPLGLVAEGWQAQMLDGEVIWRADRRFVEWNLDEVLKGDSKERWETYAVALDHGGLTLNDVRRKENLKPYEDPRADEPLIAANNVRPLSAVGTGQVANGSPGRRATDVASAGVLELVARHTRRALDRAARHAGAGGQPSLGLDRDRVERELGADLEELGLNGSSSSVAGVIADELQGLLAEAQTLEDVRGVLEAHPLLAQEAPDD